MNARPHFLFPVRALSRVFRGKFLEALVAGLGKGELRLLEDGRRDAPLAELTRTNWVVYAKPPFAGPAQVLAYLGRYTSTNPGAVHTSLPCLSVAGFGHEQSDYSREVLSTECTCMRLSSGEPQISLR